MPPPPCIRRAYRDSFALFHNAEEGRGEKGCTHIRRRRITHRKSHVWAKRKAGEKAREGPEKGSWYPPFGRDSIRGERQTATQRAATLLPSPLAPTRPRLLDLPPQLPQYRPSPTRFFYTYIYTHTRTHRSLFHHLPCLFPSSPETASFPRRVDRKFNRRFLEYFLVVCLLFLNRAWFPANPFLFTDALAFSRSLRRFNEI